MNVIRASENPFSFVVSGNALVRPIFTKVTTLTTEAFPLNGGSVTVIGDSVGNVNRIVTVRAIPNTGFKFVKWIIARPAPVTATEPTSETVDIFMDSDVTAVAFFEAVTAPEQTRVTVEVSPANSGTATISSGGETGDKGRTVTATAEPFSGYKFVKWVLTKAGQTLSEEYTTPKIDIVMNTNVTVKAIFGAVIAPLITSKIQPNIIEIVKSSTGAVTNSTQLYVNKNFDAILTAKVISSLPQGVAIALGNVSKITDSVRAASVGATDEVPVNITVNPITPDSFATTTEYPLQIETTAENGLTSIASFILRIISNPQSPIPGVGIFGTDVEVLKGSSVTSALTIFRQNFSEPLNITLSSTLPEGVTATVDPNNTANTSSSIRFNTTSTAPVGKFAVTVTATAQVNNEQITASDVVYITVRDQIIPPTNPTLQVNVTPSTGGSLTLTYTNTGGSKVSETFTSSRAITVKLGTAITAVANATTGFNFTRWSYDSYFIPSATSGNNINGSITNNASLTAIFTSIVEPPPPTPKWRSCVDGQSRDGTPPTDYKQSTYMGAGGGVCWEPPAQITFEPPMATALNFLYRRGTSEYPQAKTIKAVNPSYARTFKVTLTTNTNITLATGGKGGKGTLSFTVAPRSSIDFTVLLTPTLYDILGDGSSTLSLNVEVAEI